MSVRPNSSGMGRNHRIRRSRSGNRPLHRRRCSGRYPRHIRPEAEKEFTVIEGELAVWAPVSVVFTWSVWKLIQFCLFEDQIGGLSQTNRFSISTPAAPACYSGLLNM